MTINLSVVIPALNAEDYLPPLLKAIEAQTLAPTEIVIVDSSPSDATADIIGAWRGAIRIVYKRVDFAYPGRGRNIGVELARGEWIAFLDCRTIPYCDWLERCARVAERTGAEFVGGLCVSDADSSFKRILRAATYGHDSWKTLPGSIVLKRVFERSGGFIPDVRAGEDLEWMLRLKSLGIKLNMVASPTIRYYGLSESLWAGIRKWHRYAIANAAIEVRNNQKAIYLSIFMFLMLLLVYRYNATFAPSERSVYYLPNVTKIFAAILFASYMAYRGIIRPLRVKEKLSFLLPWRWMAIGFIGLCLDFAKAPGLIWGAIMLLKRRIGWD